jgi:hypothetical protein
MPPRQVKGPIYPEHSELAAALASCRGALLATGLINVLMLTGAIFVSVRRGRLADRVLV